MADNNEEGRINVDSFDFANEGPSEEIPMLVNYLITRLQQAMANPGLQGEVQQQLQAYEFIPPHQEERIPKKSLGETSKRGISKVREGENPYEELRNLFLDDTHQSRGRGHAQRQEPPSKEKERSESPDESMEEDVAPRRRRAQRSPTPTRRKRSPHNPPRRESKKEEKQFDAAFGDEGFTESSKLRYVAMHFQKSARQWWASLRANGEAPQTWKNLRASIMKQFLSSDAKDKVLTEWRSLRLTPYESIHKYVDKFWDLHLKDTVYKKIDFEEQKQQFCAGLPEDKVSGLTITRAHFNATTEDAMVKISDLPIFNPQGNTLDSFLDNSLQNNSLFDHAFLDKRPLLKQDPLPMNAVADALSRMPKATNFAISGVQMEIPACFKNEYLTDKDFGDAFQALKSLNPTPIQMNMFASYIVMDELLYYLDRICVPHNGALRKILIQEHHEVPFVAHPGINKTYRVTRRCIVDKCMATLKRLGARWVMSYESLGSQPWAGRLRAVSHAKGNAQILVIVDQFSKMAHFIPCKKAASAPDIASLVVQHIFRIHGLPRSIISNRDPKFTRHFWTSLFKSLGTNLLFSSAYHPQTDGQIERVNQILEEMLRHYIQQRLASWEEYLPLVEFAYNNAPHSVTDMTPFQAAYGHTLLVPTNFVLQHKVALAHQLVQEMQDILVQVRDKLVHVQQKYQKQANKHRQHAEFNGGDLVLLYVASHRYKTVKSVFPKLRPRFYGPFNIIEKNSVVSYKLELPPSW
ncbi:hypothetical protein L7F22_014649 [Adiantum nelumboides]|nr:hypothetical protein [Adiantum nelumboides]